MDDRQLKLSVGAIAIATPIVLFLLIGINTPLSFSLGGGQREVKIHATRAPGVGRNTPVRRDGVLIGRVESVEPVRGGVQITAKVSPDNPVLQSDQAQIRPSSLFGDAVIDFTQDPAGDPTPVPPEMVIRAESAPDPLAALTELQVEVAPAIQSLGRAGDSVARLAQRIDSALGDDLDTEQISRLINNLDRAAESFTSTMDSINSVVGEQGSQQQLRQAIRDFPELISSLRSTAEAADTTFRSLDSAVISAGNNLRNIECLTEPLGEKGAELVQLLTSSLENLDLILADARRFAASLNNGQGSLGRIVNERELYDNLNTTVYNANQTIVRINELAKQLRPILTDVRVVTDKVAREPGRIISGALKPGPGLK